MVIIEKSSITKNYKLVRDQNISSTTMDGIEE